MATLNKELIDRKKNKKAIEDSLFINDHAKNVTIEYWNHHYFIEGEKFHYVAPALFYPNFKVIMDEIDRANIFKEETLCILQSIDSKILQFTLWLNNNPIISAEYQPYIHTVSSISGRLLESINDAISGISNIIYLQIAPITFKIMNMDDELFSSITTDNEKESFDHESFSILNSCNDIMTKILESLPQQDDDELGNFADNIYKIIEEQGI